MFPVETISAKMLDYYVGRRDTLIIDLREKESYMHSHVKGAVNMPYGEIDGYTAFPKGKILVLYCDRGGASLLLARQLAKLGYCTRSVIRCKRKNTNRYIFRLFQKSICRHTYCANKLISRTILRLNFLFPRCRRSP